MECLQYVCEGKSSPSPQRSFMRDLQPLLKGIEHLLVRRTCGPKHVPANKGVRSYPYIVQDYNLTRVFDHGVAVCDEDAPRSPRDHKNDLFLSIVLFNGSLEPELCRTATAIAEFIDDQELL
mmetsp:Transcript_12446/g.17275  ORF Transcript_12446/g.17275 Transcript_12446/m.17275 type:complete len:122 (-) Transcript_12446:365-730(-)